MGQHSGSSWQPGALKSEPRKPWPPWPRLAIAAVILAAVVIALQATGNLAATGLIWTWLS